jgi:hypothetical protein
LESLAEEVPDATVVLSSENLEDAGMPRLFRGIDALFDVRVVFYLRPQFQWIPSAWKQWSLKTGISLEVCVRGCMIRNLPAYRKSLDAWRDALPAAAIVVRPLLREFMPGGDPGLDFLEILGLGGQEWNDWSDLSNPSLDYSILHVLSKNPQLFNSIHDNRLLDKLAGILPQEYLAANIDMLSHQQAQAVERHFREENLYILKTYCGAFGFDTEELYERLFVPRPTERWYGDEPEAEIVNRAVGILLKAILAPPKGEDQ